MQKSTNRRKKAFIQFKDIEKSIINMEELVENTRRISLHSNDSIMIMYKDTSVLYMSYRDEDSRQSDLRRMTYLLDVRKAPGRPKVEVA